METQLAKYPKRTGRSSIRNFMTEFESFSFRNFRYRMFWQLQHSLVRLNKLVTLIWINWVRLGAVSVCWLVSWLTQPRHVSSAGRSLTWYFRWNYRLGLKFELRYHISQQTPPLAISWNSPQYCQWLDLNFFRMLFQRVGRSHKYHLPAPSQIAMLPR